METWMRWVLVFIAFIILTVAYDRLQTAEATHCGTTASGHYTCVTDEDED